MLVPAARGDWAAAEAHIARCRRAGSPARLRAFAARARHVAGPGSARPAATPQAVLAALEPVPRFPYRDAADEPGFWPWQDLYADALVATGRVDGGRRASWLRTRSWRPSAGPALADRPAGPRARPGRGRRAAGRTRADAAFTARAGGDRRAAACPFERARVELAAGQFLRRAGQRRRAADLLDAPRDAGSPALGAAPYAERCAQELAALRPAAGSPRMAATGPG